MKSIEKDGLPALGMLVNIAIDSADKEGTYRAVRTENTDYSPEWFWQLGGSRCTDHDVFNFWEEV